MNKIPKRIFYVWVGGDKPNIVQMCIENWRDKLPDYELVEVNESSEYFDFEKEYNNCKWFKTVYDKKMWAYVSDYIRCKVLYDHGGVYLDTDVTLYKDITPLLKDVEMFIGKEDEKYISVGIFGVVKNHLFLKDMLDFYNNEIFESPLFTIPTIMTEVYSRKEYDIKIYPPVYFYPYHYTEKFSHDCIKENTYCVHWWSASWDNQKDVNWLKNKHMFAKLQRGLKNA